jgi:hypothetical protein
MANAKYPLGLEKILSADIDFTFDDFYVSALTSGYTYNAAHEFYSSASAHEVFTEQLTVVSIAGGVIDADDVVSLAVPTGSTITRFVIWKDGGSPGASPLIYYADQFDSGSPVSIVTNGGNVTVAWSNLPSRIFRI